MKLLCHFSFWKLSLSKCFAEEKKLNGQNKKLMFEMWLNEKPYPFLSDRGGSKIFTCNVELLWL